ncbi:hypothetical protein ACFS07_29405 [Undibacterium arcticum]
MKKNIRTVLIAVSALVLVNVAQAQTPPATDPSAAVTAPKATDSANAASSADPFVQKRQADSIAKKEYKARKKPPKKANERGTEGSKIRVEGGEIRID